MGYLKKVAICDIDGTLIRGETQFFLLIYMFRRKFVPAILFLRMVGWFVLYRLGLVQGSDRVRGMAYQVFSGWTQTAFENLCQDFFKEQLRLRIRSVVVSDLKRLNSEGYKVVLASATLRPIAECCRAFLGFGSTLATELEVVDDRLTGRINGRAVYGVNKLALVEDFMAQNGIGWEQSWAFSDHVSDFPLLLKSGTPVVVAPDKTLAVEAEKRQWVVYQ